MSCDIEFCQDMAESLNLQENDGVVINECPVFSSRVDLRGCTLKIHNDDLPLDAPVALCMGDCAVSVYSAGVHTFQLIFTNRESANSMLDVAASLFQNVFSLAQENGSKGVYLIGFGFGALIAAKLLSDRQFFKQVPSLHLFQAAYLVSGLYDVKSECIETLMSPSTSSHPTSSPQKSSPRSLPKQSSSFIENIIRDKQSFEDRKNLSFICDLNDKSPSIGEFQYPTDFRKFKQDHGIHGTNREALINSPVYQNILVDNDVPKECLKETKNTKDITELKLEICLDDFELYKIVGEEADDFSPINDDFTHLCSMGIRLYVFAGENDSAQIQMQSRSIYDAISKGCYTGNIHFQIKENLNKDDMREIFSKCHDSFLKKLIRYDIVKNL